MCKTGIVHVHSGNQLAAGLWTRQSSRMIRVHVGQQYPLDRGGVDASRGEVLLQLSGGRKQIVTRAGFDERQTTSREYRVAV